MYQYKPVSTINLENGFTFTAVPSQTTQTITGSNYFVVNEALITSETLQQNLDTKGYIFTYEAVNYEQDATGMVSANSLTSAKSVSMQKWDSVLQLLIPSSRKD